MDVLNYDKATTSGRARSACVHCRRRKTRCSGEIPCDKCTTANIKCEYRRRAKLIKVYDVEIEKYQRRIAELESKLAQRQTLGINASNDSANVSPLSSSTINSSIYINSLTVNGEEYNTSTNDDECTSIDSKNNNKNYVSSVNGLGIDTMPLSIYLGSGSGELVCWNLRRTLTKKVPQGTFISPDFNSFIEEDAYDSVFSNRNVPCLSPLHHLTMTMVLKYLDNIVQFINSGYLTLDTESFRYRLSNYFNPNFKAYSISNPGGELAPDHYFILKIIMVCTLGEVYDSDNSIGNGKVIETAGLKFFNIVLHYLSPFIATLNLSQRNLQSNIDLIETLGLASIYTRILDKKNVAVALSNNALQMCIALNLHKKGTHSDEEIRLFWSIFCLNRFFCSRIGRSLLLSKGEITTDLPIEAEPPNCTISREEFAKSYLMIHYIKLAKLAEDTSLNIYCLQPPFDNKKYLNAVFSIVHDLVAWVNSVPPHLQLQFPLKAGNPNNRLIYTLHLNYIHHIYLACIPILLNLVRLESKFNDLPKNIKNLVSLSLQQAQLTINLFIALYKEHLLRVFGFTDLDYLISSAIIFVICLLLDVPVPPNSYSFDDYLQMSMDLMAEMRNSGNLVAKGKLNQLIQLLDCSKKYVPNSIQLRFNRMIEVYGNSYSNVAQIMPESLELRDFKISKDFIDTNEPLLDILVDPAVTEEDMLFMESIINEFQTGNVPTFPSMT